MTGGVWFSCGVSSLVVLQDAMLLSFLDALPVSLEQDIEHGIMVRWKMVLDACMLP